MIESSPQAVPERHHGSQDVLEADAAELRRGIGYVIRRSGLSPHRTVLIPGRHTVDPEDVADTWAAAHLTTEK
jgi:hypothetical protein